MRQTSSTSHKKHPNQYTHRRGRSQQASGRGRSNAGRSQNQGQGQSRGSMGQLKNVLNRPLLNGSPIPITGIGVLGVAMAGVASYLLWKNRERIMDAFNSTKDRVEDFTRENFHQHENEANDEINPEHYSGY